MVMSRLLSWCTASAKQRKLMLRSPAKVAATNAVPVRARPAAADDGARDSD